MMRVLVLFCALGNLAAAQTALTLAQTIELALKNYPAARAAEADAASAAAAIDLARTAYLPRADVLAQINRASRNNILGLLLPQSVLPGVSGPVLGTNNLTNVWGSAIGFLVSWEPFDFGLRGANVNTAEATRSRAQAAVERSRLETAIQAADAYLTLAAAEQTLAGANVQAQRVQTIQSVVSALVRAELRPGADESRVAADVAAAATLIVRSEQAVRLARAHLRQFTGADVSAAAGPLLAAPAALLESGAVARNPAAVEQQAAVRESEARLKALDRSFYPKFSLQASSYARGSGANLDGTTGGPLSGIGPNIQNWAVGFTVSFSALDGPSIRARKQIEKHRQEAETARYDRLVRDLEAGAAGARAALEGARGVAMQTPIQLSAARTAEQQATARYRAGLGTLIEVAEAQRMLTQAEIDDSLARLNVWRALLGVYAVSGDIAPFLERLK